MALPRKRAPSPAKPGRQAPFSGTPRSILKRAPASTPAKRKCK